MSRDDETTSTVREVKWSVTRRGNSILSRRTAAFRWAAFSPFFVSSFSLCWHFKHPLLEGWIYERRWFSLEYIHQRLSFLQSIFISSSIPFPLEAYWFSRKSRREIANSENQALPRGRRDSDGKFIARLFQYSLMSTENEESELSWAMRNIPKLVDRLTFIITAQRGAGFMTFRYDDSPHYSLLQALEP